MGLQNLMAIVAIGIASNLDNAGVGIAYGVKKIRIPLISNIIIALMGFVLTLVGGLFGDWVSLWLPTIICNVIGMIVLVIIGVWVLCQPLLAKKSEKKPPTDGLILRILQNPENADWDGSKSVGFIESIILGVALSINNLAGGFDAGITHLNVWATSSISGIFSYICVGLFSFLGAKFTSHKLGQRASIISGTLLILVGLHQVLG
ncbi:putative sporulation protein YtaF [Paenibacillus sp. yr247]|uniref:sporulation membrane protein YtaF n=1 Tax=Paenibacillus sp. yr247 TaxID=1761880 RepID=UPI0008822DA4|nr:sporulation membrane protein YtaF [Paenibacillus sp. yr247]SDN33444.1 putative sporulation protein YtaF [Paenibacillus sp. yr247]